MDFKWLKILPILGRDKEKETVELFKRFISEILEAKQPFIECTKAFKKNDYKRMYELIGVINKHENNADKLRREVSRMLYSGAFMPAMRSRLFSLTDYVDDVIDTMQDAVDKMIYLKRAKVPDRIKDLYVNMAQECCVAMEDLNKVLISFFQGSPSIMNDIKKANVTEHNLDLLKRDVLGTAIFDKKMDPVVVWLCCDVASLLAGVGDAVENCCDNVAVLRLLRRA
ncbi:MAG: DUF47 family protein [Candidatus Nanoarchaeia archaeon]|nr:DUF47 family protein [Candidatus Nanoarchaeia archaeon]